MEQKNFITSWQEAHAIIDEAMTKGDRSVSIYISPDGGMSISVYPWPDEESLRTAYEQGKISYNDYRAKLGLPMIKNNENHFSTRVSAAGAPDGIRGVRERSSPERPAGPWR